MMLRCGVFPGATRRLSPRPLVGFGWRRGLREGIVTSGKKRLPRRALPPC
jgi:hypothetical protein